MIKKLSVSKLFGWLYNTRKSRKKKTKKKNSDINNSDILNGRYKSEDQKSAIKNIETLYESREKVIKLFNYHSKIASMAKYEAKNGKELKIFTPEQILQYCQ